jgi:hypothetical protein
MPNLIVVNNPGNWTFGIPGVDLVSARSYLMDSKFSKMRHTRVFNLCKSFRYQSTGYYVSLLAAARGHKPLPNISTIQDLKSQTQIRFVDDDLDELIQKSLAPIQSAKFTLSIYFGKNTARRYDRLAIHLYNLFPAPLLRAEFIKNKSQWHLQSIRPVSTGEVPSEHYDFLVGVATVHFQGRGVGTLKRKVQPYDMAILWNPKEEQGPSNEKAIKKFVNAGQNTGFNVKVVSRDEIGSITVSPAEQELRDLLCMMIRNRF